MTLDEAIKHAEEVAEEKEQDRDVRKIHLDNRNNHNNIVHYRKACKCAEEHRQLAEWLKELKQLRKQEKTGHWIGHSDEGYVVNVLREDKDLICKELAKLLKLTRNQSDLKALRYEILDNNDEIVTIEWEGGGRKVVCVSMDSGVAMIRDIMRAID